MTMLRLRTYRYILILIISVLAMPVSAQQEVSEKKTIVSKGEDKKEKTPWLGGVAVSADLCGLSMKLVGAKFANMEIAGRLNIKEKFFPILEVGIGDCTRQGGENSNVFSCTSPYWRVGMDYNVNKKPNGNRFFAGGRYAFSRFKYDYTAPSLMDPVYHVEMPLDLKSQDGYMQWFELVVGFETKMWSIVRLGWNFRYRMYLTNSFPENGDPYFVPGYGKFGVSTFGGTVNLVFDVGKTAFKK